MIGEDSAQNRIRPITQRPDATKRLRRRSVETAVYVTRSGSLHAERRLRRRGDRRAAAELAGTGTNIGIYRNIVPRQVIWRGRRAWICGIDVLHLGERAGNIAGRKIY